MRHEREPPLSDGNIDGDGGDSDHTQTAAGAQLKVTAPVALTQGAVIDGRYQVEASIGQGGSGTVFRAWDRVLGEPVAIKILHPERAKETAWIKRLAREVKVARAIRHPNVCRVFDLGHADGHWFVTMELAVGGALRKLLRDQAETSSERPMSERLADARSLCAGLAAIHAVGIIHRDVTPQNVLRMGDGRLVLSDFGLAIDKTDNTTVHGGTPAYMPPEALLGGRSDQKSDVWQLGAILHEILFGRKPAWQQTSAGMSMEWPFKGVVSPVEEELARLCGDCLAHDPAARPATAMAVAGRLAAAEVARPRGRLLRGWLSWTGFWRAHRRLQAALMAAVVAIAGVRGAQWLLRPSLCRGVDQKLVGVWDPRLKAGVRKSFLGTGKPYAVDTFWSVNRLIEDYVRRWSDMYKDACEATQTRGEQSAEVLDLRMGCLQSRLGGLKALTEIFTQADGAVVENAPGAVSQLGTIEQCADVKLLRAVVPLPDDNDARERVADLQRRLASVRALRDAGRVGDASKLGEPLVAEARHENYGPVLAEALKLRGMALYEFASDPKAAEGVLEEALWEAEASRNDEGKAEIASFLVAASGVTEGRFAEAEKWSHLTEATLRRIGGHERLGVWVKTNMGAMYDTMGKFKESLEQHQQALAIATRALRPDDPDVIRANGNVAMALNELGRVSEALEVNDRAVVATRRGLGSEHPLMGIQLTNRGEMLNALQRWEEARGAFTQAQAIWEKQLAPEHAFFAYPLTGIGLGYLGERKPAQAIAPLERALGIRRANGEAPKRMGETLFALARALWDAGQDRPRAHTLAFEARDSYQKVAALKQQSAEVSLWLSQHAAGAAAK